MAEDRTLVQHWELKDVAGCKEARVINYDFHTRAGATALGPTVEVPSTGLRGMAEKAKLIAALAFVLARNKNKNLG